MFRHRSDLFRYCFQVFKFLKNLDIYSVSDALLTGSIGDLASALAFLVYWPVISYKSVKD
jgi:hypothetical protein